MKTTLIKLTTFLSLNLLLSGCISINLRQPLSPFPDAPESIEYTKDPVVRYNENGTYTVTDEMVKKTTLQHIYIKEIIIWKNKNNIQ